MKDWIEGSGGRLLLEGVQHVSAHVEPAGPTLFVRPAWGVDSARGASVIELEPGTAEELAEQASRELAKLAAIARQRIEDGCYLVGTGGNPLAAMVEVARIVLDTEVDTEVGRAFGAIPTTGPNKHEDRARWYRLRKGSATFDSVETLLDHWNLGNPPMELARRPDGSWVARVLRWA